MLHSFSIYLLNKGLELLEILSNSTFQRFILTLFSRGLAALLLAILNVPFLTSTYFVSGHFRTFSFNGM